MQGLFLLVALLFLFIALGLVVEEMNGPVRLLMAAALLAPTGWYMIF